MAGHHAGTGGPAVTWRSMLLSLILIPANAYWLIQMEVIRYSAHPTTVSLFFNAVFILLVVTLLNALVGRYRPSWALRRGELYVVYVSMALASALAGHDTIQVFTPMLTWPFQHKDRTGWARWIPELPQEWMVTDPNVYRSYYLGSDTLYRPEYLRAWIGPVLVWTVFIAALLLVMQCVNVLLRKQWTDRERLSYPIVQLPMEIAAVGPGGKLPPLFSDRLLWIGFALAGFVDIVNSLNLYYPWIPTILTPGRGESFFDLRQIATTKPLNAIGWTPISWYPFLIGLGMLLPVDFLFSAWFFYLFWKGQLVVSSMMAWDQDPQFPYPNAQAFGAYMAFFVYTVWLSRGYLAQLARKILGARSDLDDSKEPLTYRQATLGIAIGMAVILWFSMRLGMPLWVAFVFFGIYFALALAITRMRAELGTPIHDLHFTGPDWTLSQVIGSRDLGQETLTSFTMLFWLNRAYRGHAMPHQLEGFKMAEQSGGEYRKWFWWMLAVGIFGTLCGFWAMLHLNYEFGATAKARPSYGNEPFARITSWLGSPQPPNQKVAIATCIGFAFAMFLQFMRVRIPWWPFHPLGFAVTSSWEINLVWMPLFLAWLLKLVILRYSGLPGYRRSLPFFFGLMLGQFVIGSILNIWGIARELPTYQFWQ
jgi:hypothetical protein